MMHEKFLLSSELLMKQAQEVNLDNQPHIQQLVLGAAASGDLEVMNQVQQMFLFNKLDQVVNPHPFKKPHLKQLIEGDRVEDCIVLGKIKGSNTPFIISIMLLAMHCEIFGRPGVGKSTLLYWFASQTMLKGKSVWMFDRDKQDYRHLKRLFPNLLVFRVGQTFKLNPLEPPPDVDPKVWLQEFIKIFARTNNLLDGGENVLIRLLNELFQTFGVFDGSDCYPSLFDLFEKVRELKVSRFSREAGFRDSILNRLEAYLITNPDLYDCSKGFPLDELAKKSIVFELSGFPENQAKFLMNYFLYWLFHYRVAHQVYDQGLQNLIVIDECKWLLPPKAQNSAIAWAPITYMLAQLRALNVGIVLADQTLALDESAHVNTFLKFIYSLGSGKDLKNASEVLSLSKEQRDHLHRLKRGEAVVRYPKVPFPFVIEVPPFPLS